MLQSEESSGSVLCKSCFKNLAKFTGKYLCLRPVTLSKKRPWSRCFPVNFEKILRTSIFTENNLKNNLTQNNLTQEELIFA